MCPQHHNTTNPKMHCECIGAYRVPASERDPASSLHEQQHSHSGGLNIAVNFHLPLPQNGKTDDVEAMRTAVLRCLPVFLWDDGSDFFKVCFDTDTIADVTQVPVGVLTVIQDRQQPGPHALHLEPSSIAIILEGNIVVDDIRVMLNLGVGNLRPKLQSLKNFLLQQVGVLPVDP
ncbi:hypothetical protein JOB18_046934 [Solea senegalensis]|uniref:Uncharacterized protein n=1 Tax=Solea senegalensis TaxID=28829 RepID=A0AAV6PMF2_SOLSE|nr:hypothetical protein JOB18_046934 [Solea senegalensis]